MSLRNRSFPLPWVVLGVSLLTAGTGYALHAAAPEVADPVEDLEVAQELLNLAWLSYGVLGALILRARPRHPIGWILLGAGLLEGTNILASGWSAYTLATDPDHLGGTLGVWFQGHMWVPLLLVPPVFLPLLFPDGGLPSRRWRPWAWAGGTLIALAWVGFAFAPGPLEDEPGLTNPLGIPGAQVLQAALLPAPALLGLAVGAVVVRRRRARGIEREQLRWLVYALWVTLLVSLVLPFLGPWGPLPAVFVLVAVVALPVAITIAITRYRVYDIDLLVNRSLLYGGLSALVLATYAVVVVVAGRFAGTDLAWRQSVLVTAAIATAAYPAREWLQRLVNRFMYGDRDDPYAAMSKLARRLSDAETPASLLPTLAETVAHAMRLPYVAVTLGSGQATAAYGTARGEPHRLPLVHQGEPVGELVLGRRAPNEEFSAADLRLLDDVACQAAVAAHALNLAEDLQRARERLVLAREEERRRLRRDLHDGLGSTLAGLALLGGNARRALSQEGTADLEEARRWLSRLEERTAEAVADLRRLVNDLRPPALDELGLAGALRACADGLPLEVQVDMPEPLPPLSAAVEVAAYRIAVEAMTNAVRHGDARHCRVALGVNGGLNLEVLDDGAGFEASARPGVGLVSMRERAAELGGSCTVTSAPGRGTTVNAVLPVRSG